MKLEALKFKIWKIAERERPFHGFPLTLHNFVIVTTSERDTSVLVLDFSVKLVEFHVLWSTKVNTTCPIGCLLKASAIDSES